MQEEIITLVNKALDDRLNETMGGKRYVDLSRIPLICQAVVNIDARLKSIEGNMTWAVRIVIAAVFGSLLMLVLK